MALNEKIWNANVAFNVQAPTQQEAATKLAAYLRQHFSTGYYEAIEPPTEQVGLTADDCETLIL
jgi:hypothetical protein